MSFYHRRLPHWHPDGADLFITWRLHGSLPSPAVIPAQLPASAGAAFLAFDKGLDAATQGPVWLKDPRVAALVVSSLRSGDTEMALYRLGAFVVMANHVHALLEPMAPVPRITQWIKGNTARGANQLLGRSGEPFWQHESFDHWVRNRDERRHITRYIELNPVAAGLAESAGRWPWSSAAVTFDSLAS